MSGNGTGPRWFHGGRPGLRVGQRIRPAAETGTMTSAQQLALIGLDPHANGMEADRALTSVVYLTSARDLALGYAAAWEHQYRGRQFATGVMAEPMRLGTLYEVAPAPGAQPDPDFEPDFHGLCVQASYANVLTVVRRRVHLPPDEWRLIMLKYTTWAAGTVCPDCGHDTLATPPFCPCPSVGCLCEALRADPTALQRVR